MNIDGGYTRNFRRLWSDPVFKNKQEAGIFSWMISAASWKGGVVRTKFGPVTLEVGELIISERELADDFGVNRTAVRALLQRLVDHGIISTFRERIPARCGTIVSIEKYKDYQCIERAFSEDENHKQTAKEPQENRKRTKIKEGKESKLEDIPIGLSSKSPAPQKCWQDDPEFVEFYGIFPLKVDPQDGWKVFLKTRKTVSLEVLMEGVRRYSAECRGRERRFIRHPATWLNKGSWQSEPLEAQNGGFHEQLGTGQIFANPGRHSRGNGSQNQSLLAGIAGALDPDEGHDFDQ